MNYWPRDEIHMKLQSLLTAETAQWRIKVDAVEIKHVDQRCKGG